MPKVRYNKLPLRNRAGEIVNHTLVEPEDYARFRSKRWSLTGAYVQGWHDGHVVFLHRVILDLGRGGPQVDHINRNPLDNRRANLRVCSHAENHQNIPPQPGSRSRFRGVWWENGPGKWRASVNVGGKRHHCGFYDDEAAAGEAARAGRLRLMTHAVD